MAHDFLEECLLESDGVAAACLLLIKATPEQRTPTGFCHTLLSLLPLPLLYGLIVKAFGDFHAMRSSAEAARFIDPRAQCGMGLPPGEETPSIGRKDPNASSLEIFEFISFLGTPNLVDFDLDLHNEMGPDRLPDTH